MEIEGAVEEETQEAAREEAGAAKKTRAPRRVLRTDQERKDAQREKARLWCRSHRKSRGKGATSRTVRVNAARRPTKAEQEESGQASLTAAQKHEKKKERIAKWVRDR